ILIDVLARGNVRTVEEVGYGFPEREDGENNLTNAVCFDYLRQLLQLRVSRRRNALVWDRYGLPLRRSRHHHQPVSPSLTCSPEA
ncbi:MAG: hypothetical protein AAF191_11175, partial [Verrucomicrobiota bacterium]